VTEEVEVESEDGDVEGVVESWSVREGTSSEGLPALR